MSEEREGGERRAARSGTEDGTEDKN